MRPIDRIGHLEEDCNRKAHGHLHLHRNLQDLDKSDAGEKMPPV